MRTPSSAPESPRLRRRNRPRRSRRSASSISDARASSSRRCARFATARPGMALNAVRERLEAAIDAREAELARAELDERLTTERVDVTLPAGGYARGRLHLITQIRREVEDVFLGLGYSVVDGREVETTRYNFDGLNFPPGHPARSPARDAVRRRRHGASHRDVAVAGAHDGGAAAARSTSSRSAARTAATRRTRRTRRSSIRSRASPSTRASRSPISPARSISCSRSSSASSGAPSSVPTTSRSRSRRSRRTCRATCATEQDARCAGTRAGSRSAAPAWSIRSCSSSSATTPSATRGFAFGWGLERIAMLRHEFPDLRELWRNDLRFSSQF